MRIFYWLIWRWRRWRLKREWTALDNLYERYSCGASLAEEINTELASRRARFDANLERLKQFDSKYLSAEKSR